MDGWMEEHLWPLWCPPRRLILHEHSKWHTDNNAYTPTNHFI
jgi:hypothetical protein